MSNTNIDLFIDRNLVLAIRGHAFKIVEVHFAGRKRIEVNRRVFSHKDQNVINPIEVRYDAFPFQDKERRNDDQHHRVWADGRGCHPHAPRLHHRLLRQELEMSRLLIAEQLTDEGL